MPRGGQPHHPVGGLYGFLVIRNGRRAKMRKAINLKDGITSAWQYSHAVIRVNIYLSEATRIREYVRVGLDHRLTSFPFMQPRQDESGNIQRECRETSRTTQEGGRWVRSNRARPMRTRVIA